MRKVTRPASSRPVSSYGYISLNPSTRTPSSQHPHRHIQERETWTEEPPFHTQVSGGDRGTQSVKGSSENHVDRVPSGPSPATPCGRIPLCSGAGGLDPSSVLQPLWPKALPGFAHASRPSGQPPRNRPTERPVSRPPTLKVTRGGGRDGSEGAKSAPCALAAEMKARHRLRCRGLRRKHAQEDSGVAETRGLTGGSSRPRCDREEGDQGLTRGCLGQLTFASPDPGALAGPGCTSEPDSGCRYLGASGHAAGQCQLLLPLSGAQAPGRTAPSSSRAPSTPEAPSRKATKGPKELLDRPAGPLLS
nr:PREDICTED: uncharacterized protein LOC109455585 [Rhinolophus sinicus]